MNKNDKFRLKLVRHFMLMEELPIKVTIDKMVEEYLTLSEEKQQGVLDNINESMDKLYEEKHGR